MKRVFGPDQLAQLDQFEEMVKEGRSFDEVAKFFQDQYQIEITLSYFYKTKKQLKGAASPGDPINTKRKYSRKAKDLDVKEDNILKEIIQLLGQVHGGYHKMFKYLRGELIKSRAQVYDMLKGAGILDEEI